MSTRQYIGARYVPKFASPSDWNNALSYEALTIVTHLGNSFTSKKPVPAGVNIDNTEYWVNTGNYNAQIEQFRNDCESLKQIVNSAFINVLDYGAKGDGVTDETQAFQTCLNSGYHTILIPAGTYLISSPLDVKSNTTIICYGKILHRVNNGNYNSTFMCNNKENIVFYGLNFIGTGAVNNANVALSCCIYFYQCRNVKCLNCSFEEIQSLYCVLFDGCDGCWCKNCYINKYSCSGICAINYTHNLYINSNTVLECVNTSLVNTYPIILSGFDRDVIAGANPPHNLNCNNNYIKNTIPWWEGIDAHGGDNLKIAGNTIIGCASGIAVFDDLERNIVLTNALISNNYIELGTNRSYARHIQNSCVTFSGDNVVVDSNIMLNGGYLVSTLGLENSYPSAVYALNANGVFSNNIIKNAYGCVFDFRSCSNANVFNNSIDGLNQGSNTNANAIFCLYGNEYNENIICNRNTGKNLNNNPILSIGGTNNKAYYNFKNNNFHGYTPVSNVNAVIDQNDISALTMGRSGDVILKTNISVGESVGWICISSNTTTTNAFWVELPTL